MPNLPKHTMSDHDNQLRHAEERVGAARRIVKMQKGRTIHFKAAGADTCDAERALRLFESNLRFFEEHRNILQRASS